MKPTGRREPGTPGRARALWPTTLIHTWSWTTQSPFRVILRLWSTQFGQRLFFAAPRARQPDLQFRVLTDRSSGPSRHFARTWFAYLWSCFRDDQDTLTT